MRLIVTRFPLGLLVLISSVQFSCKTTLKEGGFGSTLSEVFLKSDSVINNETFLKHSSNNDGRDNQELEVVMSLQGLDLEVIRDIGLNHLTEGRSIVKPHHAKAWLYGSEHDSGTLGLEVLDWSMPNGGDPLANEQVFRESHPYFWMSIYSSRVDKSNSGRFKVKPSHDYFVDVYYDTNDFALADNNIVVRSRIRFNGPNTLSRLLIQSKIGGGIDPKTGIKKTHKQDIRLNSWRVGEKCGDGSNCWNAINTLDEIVKSGVGKGEFTPGEGVGAIRAVYEKLSKVSPNSLKGEKKELRLQPAAAVLSRRARYHLVKTRLDRVQELRQHCLSAIESLRDKLISFGDEDARFLAHQIGEIMNVSGIVEQDVRTNLLQGYKGELSVLVPGPESHRLDPSQLLLSHKLAEFLSSRVEGWVNQVQSKLTLQGEDLTLLTKARMYGKMYKTMWYTGAFRKTSGGFTSSPLIIDTFDYSQSMTIAEFEKFTNDEVRWVAPFDRDLKKYNVLEAAIVNEVQIELTEVDPFIRNLDSSNPATREIAQIIMDQVKKLQFGFAQRRLPELRRDLNRLGYNNFKWDVASESKGQRAIRMVRERSVDLKKRWYCDPNNPYPNQSCFAPRH